jgi:DNA-binding NarL/FixJ family response regulator
MWLVLRIVFVRLPALLRELIREAVEAQPDLQVVGELDDASALEDAIAGTGARAVVAADDALEEAAALELVGATCVRVVRLSADGRRASLYESRPQREDVGDVDLETLVRLLRLPESQDASS